MRERSPHTLPRNHCFYQLENWSRTFKIVLSKMIQKVILPRIHCFHQMENWNRTFKESVVKKETQQYGANHLQRLFSFQLLIIKYRENCNPVIEQPVTIEHDIHIRKRPYLFSYTEKSRI